MKVFVLSYDYCDNYHGSGVLSVHSSRESAEAAKSREEVEMECDCSARPVVTIHQMEVKD